jgi:hypothetical protein
MEGLAIAVGEARQVLLQPPAAGLIHPWTLPRDDDQQQPNGQCPQAAAALAATCAADAIAGNASPKATSAITYRLSFRTMFNLLD